MGLLSRFEKPVQSTADDPAAVNTAARLSTEKTDVRHVKNGTGGPNTEITYHVTPAMEKSLLRKLDKRLVSLVTVLYLFSYLDRSNIG